MRAREQGRRPRLHLARSLRSARRKRHTTHALFWMENPHHPVDPYSGQFLPFTAPRNMRDCLCGRDTNVAWSEGGESRCLVPTVMAIFGRKLADTTAYVNASDGKCCMWRGRGWSL